jgi:hypothetical protein
MKKIIYIIPGLGEHCNLARYKKLTDSLKTVGYTVKKINPNWYRPLSELIFPVEKNAIVFGFSFGAVIAYLTVRKYPCRKVIFGSISPIHAFSFKSLVEEYSEHMSKDLSKEIATDIKNIKISLKELQTPFVTLAGEYEKMKADFYVPSTEHRVNSAYINSICKLL